MRILLIALAAAALLVTPAAAAPSYEVLAEVSRDTFAYAPLPDGALAFQHGAGTLTHESGYVTMPTSIAGPYDRAIGFISRCAPAGCIYADDLSSSAPPPRDPLLEGGVRFVQATVIQGPAGCVGSIVSLTYDARPAGPIAVWQTGGGSPSPEGVVLIGQMSAVRPMNVSGSLVSCLGAISFTSTTFAQSQNRLDAFVTALP